MTVAISGHFIMEGRVGGAEHMAYNVVRGVEKAGVRTILLCSQPRRLAPEFVAESMNSGRAIWSSGGEGTRFVAEQRACIASGLMAEAILFPNYSLPLHVPRRLGRRCVVIHDFQYRHFPQHFSAKKRAWLRFSHRHALARADQVIFISEFVRSDAIRLYGRAAERGVVIHNPVSWERFGNDAGATPFDGRRYILSVAAHYPHKRLDVLINAFARLACHDRDTLLVLVGQRAGDLVSVGSDTMKVSDLIAQLNLSDRVITTGYVDERRLGALYRHANVFALPSSFEGFGMPAVEALGFGIPCVTSRITALSETTLGLAMYVDRHTDIEEWCARLAEALEAPRLSPESIEQVRDHYSLEKIGQRYREILVG